MSTKKNGKEKKEKAPKRTGAAAWAFGTRLPLGKFTVTALRAKPTVGPKRLVKFHQKLIMNGTISGAKAVALDAGVEPRVALWHLRILLKQGCVRVTAEKSTAVAQKTQPKAKPAAKPPRPAAKSSAAPQPKPTIVKPAAPAA